MSMGGGESGGSQSTQTIQKSDPWSGQQPYLTTGFQKAGEFLNGPPNQYFQGQVVTPFSPETQAALMATTLRAVNGSPVNAAATRQTMDTLNGNYLFGNPGFDNAFGAAFNSASNKIIPQVQSAFERAGRTGSGLAQTAQTQALGDAFANLYMPAWQGERENQMRAALFAPQVANQDYTDIQQLANVGAQEEALTSDYLKNATAQYYYNQGAPLEQLQNYMNIIQGNYGGTSSSSSTSDVSGAGSGGRNPLISGVGGLLSSSILGVSPMTGLAMGILGGF